MAEGGWGTTAAAAQGAAVVARSVHDGRCGACLAQDLRVLIGAEPDPRMGDWSRDLAWAEKQWHYNGQPGPDWETGVSPPSDRDTAQRALQDLKRLGATMAHDAVGLVLAAARTAPSWKADAILLGALLLWGELHDAPCTSYIIGTLHMGEHTPNTHLLSRVRRNLELATPSRAHTKALEDDYQSAEAALLAARQQFQAAGTQTRLVLERAQSQEDERWGVEAALEATPAATSLLAAAQAVAQANEKCHAAAKRLRDAERAQRSADEWESK